MGIERKLGHLIARFALAGVVLSAGGQKVSAQEDSQSNSNNHIQIEANCAWHPLVSIQEGRLSITRSFRHVDVEIQIKNIPPESEGILALNSEDGMEKVGILFRMRETSDFKIPLHYYMGPMTPGQTPPPRFRENQLYVGTLYSNQKELGKKRFLTPTCDYPSSGLLV